MYELGDSDRATVQPFLADLLVERGPKEKVLSSLKHLSFCGKCGRIKTDRCKREKLPKPFIPNGVVVDRCGCNAVMS